MKNGIGDTVTGLGVDQRVVGDLVAGVDNVSQHRKQQFFDALDHLAVHQRRGGGVDQFKTNAAFQLNQAYIKVCITLQQGLSIVDMAAAVEDRQ